MSDEKESISFTAQNMIVIAALVVSAHPLVYSRYSKTEDTDEDDLTDEVLSLDEKHFYEEMDEITEKLNRWIPEEGNGFSGIARAMKVLGIEITGDDLKKILQRINILGNSPSEVEESRFDYLLPPPGTTIN